MNIIKRETVSSQQCTAVKLHHSNYNEPLKGQTNWVTRNFVICFVRSLNGQFSTLVSCQAAFCVIYDFVPQHRFVTLVSNDTQNRPFSQSNICKHTSRV